MRPYDTVQQVLLRGQACHLVGFKTTAYPFFFMVTQVVEYGFGLPGREVDYGFAAAQAEPALLFGQHSVPDFVAGFGDAELIFHVCAFYTY